MARRPEPRWYDSRGGWYCWINGRQVRLAAGKDAKDEAYKVYHRLMLEAGEKPAGVSGPMRVRILADLSLDDVKAHRADSTYRWYLRHLAIFCETFGNRRAEDVTADEIGRWLATKSTWSRSTRHGMVTAIRRIYRWGLRRSHIASDPTVLLERPGIESRRLVLTREQVDSILAMADDAFRDLIRVLHLTGMRPSEAYRLEASQVDWARGLAVFRRHKTSGKTLRPRVVQLTSEAVDVLRPLARAHPKGPLLLNSRGTPWTPHTVAHRFERLRSKVGGGAELTAVALRHLYITDGLEKGVPIATMAELAGHRSTKMIEDHYSHLGDRGAHLSEAAGKIRPSSSAEDAEAPPRPKPLRRHSARRRRISGKLPGRRG